MGLLQLGAQAPVATAGWQGTLLVLLAVVGLVLLGLILVRLGRLGQQLGDLAERTRQLDRLAGLDQLERLDRLEGLAELGKLGELQSLLERLTAGMEQLDQRRLELILIELRDQQRLLAQEQSSAVSAALAGLSAPAAPEAAPVPRPVRLGERVVNRLLAMGYEKVQLVTDSDLLEDMADGDGEVLVEAYRSGVLHKGRMVVSGGILGDVDVHPTYSIFP